MNLDKIMAHLSTRRCLMLALSTHHCLLKRNDVRTNVQKYAKRTKVILVLVFPSLGSIRRKSKSSQPDITEQSIQQRFGHSGSLVDIHSMRSAQSYDNRRQSKGIEAAMPRLRKAASFAAATFHRQQPQMIKSTTPPAVTDSEGYSIPPPDRNRPWTTEKSECSIGAEDTSSDNGR